MFWIYKALNSRPITDCYCMGAVPSLCPFYPNEEDVGLAFSALSMLGLEQAARVGTGMVRIVQLRLFVVPGVLKPLP